MQKFKIQKNKLNTGLARRQAGMTYVELIVVLSIFSIISTVVLFNYGKFQAKVDVKTLANDIAIKIVEAQKSSMSGKWNSGTLLANWKPSYGLYFNTTTSTKSKKFLYFSDLDNDDFCDAPNCIPSYSIGGEVLDIINITKGNSVSGLQVFGSGCASPITVTSVSFVFKRPSSSPTISSTSGCTAVSYVAITITSPQSSNATIKLYPSGRVQIN
mgnify:CR=1 FL=1